MVSRAGLPSENSPAAGHHLHHRHQQRQRRCRQRGIAQHDGEPRDQQRRGDAEARQQRAGDEQLHQQGQPVHRQVDAGVVGGAPPSGRDRTGARSPPARCTAACPRPPRARTASPASAAAARAPPASGRPRPRRPSAPRRWPAGGCALAPHAPNGAAAGCRPGTRTRNAADTSIRLAMPMRSTSARVNAGPRIAPTVPAAPM